MPITTYTDLVDGIRYYEGQLTNLAPSEVYSAVNGDNEVITFGKGVAFHSTAGEVVIPGATSFRFAGVAMATDTFEKRASFSLDANDKMGYPIDWTVSFVRRGIVAVPCDSDCTFGAAVYLIHTASSGQTPGHFRKDANTDKADLVPGAVFWSTLAAAGVALIKLNG